MDKQTLDFEAFKKQAAARLKSGEALPGKDGVLTPLLKEFLEEALEGKLEAHIDQAEDPNRKNGKVKKKVKTPVGEGFADAIESIFPQTEVQLCVVHQIRNSHKYLSYKDVKPSMKDLQGVYKANTKEQAERNLDQVAANWGSVIPRL